MTNTQRAVRETPLDPFKVARTYIRHEASDSKTRYLLRYWRREWWRYVDGHYAVRDETSIRTALTMWIKVYIDKHRISDQHANLRQVTPSLVSTVLHTLKAMVEVAEDTDQPAWLGNGPAREFLAVQNTLLDLGCLQQSVTDCLEALTPDWFSPVVLPVRFDAAADCPEWDQFLVRVLEGDCERIEVLQEWFGYCVRVDTTQQKFLLLEGEGANGKSVVTGVLTHLLGEANVSHVPLEAFGQRFQLTMTLGKLANIVPEVGDLRGVAEGTLKQFTGGDRMYFDRKGIPGVNVHPSARLVLATNHRPRFADRSSGLWRRMLFMPFRVSIPPEEQDPLLGQTLRHELPGILNWAIEGLRRLRQQGRFTHSTVMTEALEQYQQESNPAQEFLTECCRQEPGSVVPGALVYDIYDRWCGRGHVSPLDIRAFGKELKKRYPGVVRKKRQHGADRQWCYFGLTVDQLPHVDQGDTVPIGGDLSSLPTVFRRKK